MPEYVLPDLPYDHSALEPHISGRIMELHHDKHHQTYVTGANTALEKLADARASGNFDTVNQQEKNLAFNLAGHVNHSVFWPNMTPDGAGRPVRSRPRSRTTSAGSTASRPTSPPPRSVSRAPAGPR